MIKDKYIPRAEWERILRGYGCRPAENLGPLNTAEWWRLPRAAPFTVPIEEDGSVEHWAFRRLRQAQGFIPGDPDF